MCDTFYNQYFTLILIVIQFTISFKTVFPFSLQLLLRKYNDMVPLNLDYLCWYGHR